MPYAPIRTSSILTFAVPILMKKRYPLFLHPIPIPSSFHSSVSSQTYLSSTILIIAASYLYPLLSLGQQYTYYIACCAVSDIF